jgi:hypothetical protein
VFSNVCELLVLQHIVLSVPERKSGLRLALGHVWKPYERRGVLVGPGPKSDILNGRSTNAKKLSWQGGRQGEALVTRTK